MLTALLGLGAVVLLTIGTALFVAAEFALVAADRAELEAAARTGDRRAKAALAAVRTLSFQLSGSQLGITVTTLAVGFLAEPSISRLLRPALESTGLPDAGVDTIGVILALVIATVLQMVFGELVPKNWAIARPTPVARAVSGPMRLFTVTLGPVISVCNGAANAIVRSLGIEPQEELRSARSAAELGSLVRTSADEGSLPGTTAFLLARSLAFGERTAGEVMTPRTRMVTLAADGSVEHLLAVARTTGHSRFPIIGTGQDADAIDSVVHLKRAFTVPASDRAVTTLGAIAAPIPQVPDSLHLEPLLALLRRPGFQMALVVDEYGGIAGIVTLEDLVEELVGEVDDEHDAPSSEVALTADGTFLVDGLLRIDEARRHTGFDPPEGPYDTLGGVVMHALGRLPEPGDEVDVAGWHVRVRTMDGHRVDTVTLRSIADDGEAGEPR